MEMLPQFHRIALMVGDEGLQALQSTHVAVFGVGGVGSWCAESLIRSGIGKLTIVDSDTVCITNVNRQLQATTRNVGRSKVHEIAERLRDINPQAEIEVIHGIYSPELRADFHLNRFDYVIDAIDSLSNKVDLVISASEAGCTVFSSMGAGNKMDPSQIRQGDIWKTQMCALAKAVRCKLRERNFTGKLTCVYSLESPQKTQTTSVRDGSDITVRDILDKEWSQCKAPTNGSLVFITAIFGNFLASMVFHDVMEKLASK